MKEDPDIEILRQDPSALIYKYRDMIRIIVVNAMAGGLGGRERIASVVDTVTSELMLRIPSIQANYNGTSLVRTYVSAVVRNICRSLRMSQPAEKSLDDPAHEEAVPLASMHERYSINQARSVFRAILLQFDRSLPKLIVCLKLKFRIALGREDFLRWQPGCDQHILSDFLADMQTWPESLTDMEIFRRSTPLFNHLQSKEATDDTVRRWTSSKIAEIADALNCSIPGAHFDEETIRLLTEDYFSPFLLRD